MAFLLSEQVWQPCQHSAPEFLIRLPDSLNPSLFKVLAFDLHKRKGLWHSIFSNSGGWSVAKRRIFLREKIAHPFNSLEEKFLQYTRNIQLQTLPRPACYLRIVIHWNSIFWLIPNKALRNLYFPLFQPVLQRIPISTFVMRIRMRCRVLMIQDPIVRNYARIKLAHKILSDIVNAMLVVSLIKLWDCGLPVFLLRNQVYIMILPDVMKAMQLVRADCRGNEKEEVKQTTCALQEDPLQ